MSRAGASAASAKVGGAMAAHTQAASAKRVNRSRMR